MKTLVSTFNTKRKMIVFMKLKPGEDRVAWSLSASLKVMFSLGKCKQT